MFAKELLRSLSFFALSQNYDQAVCFSQCQFHSICNAQTRFLRDHNAIDNDFDTVFLILIEYNVFVEKAHLTINTNTNKALLSHVLKFFAVFAFAISYDRRENGNLRLLFDCQHFIDDLRRTLSFNWIIALIAKWLSDSRKQETKIVVYLGNGCDGGARVF